MPQAASRYESFMDTGMEDETAYRLTNILKELEPLDGKTSVSNQQKYEAIMGAGLSEADQMRALSVVMPDTTYAKLEIAYPYGVTPEAWVELQRILPQFDADSSGGYNQKEVQAAIDSFGTSAGLNWGIELPTASLTLRNDAKAALWQIVTDGKDGKKNPYSTSIGKTVYDAVHGAPEEPLDWSSGIMLPTASDLNW